MLLGERTGVWSGGSGLPYKRQVAYLSAINGAWTKLEVTIANTDTIKARFRANYRRVGCIFGRSFTTVQNLIAIYADGRINWFGGGHIIGTYETGVWNEVEVYPDGKVKFNGNVTNGLKPTNLTGIGIFAIYNGAQLSLCDMSSFEIVGKMKLMPVVNDFGNGEEGCFYDEITGDFHRTQGAAFTWGELNA